MNTLRKRRYGPEMDSSQYRAKLLYILYIDEGVETNYQGIGWKAYIRSAELLEIKYTDVQKSAYVYLG